MLSATRSAYAAANNVLALIDPVGNRTGYLPDALNRTTRETNALDVGRGTARTFEYDAGNNLVYSKDRNQRERTFGYDFLDRRTGETWVASNPPRTLSWRYDSASNLILAHDVDARYSWQYDLLGRSTAVDNGGTAGVAAVVLTPSYNAASERTSLSATRGGLADFTNAYGIDTLGRMRLLTQTSQPGGSAVAAKRVTLDYNSLDQTTSIQRHRDLLGTQLVASSALTYEAGDRLRGLTHTPAVTAARAYSLVQDSGDRLVQHSLPDGASSFGYDRANRLTAASHSFQAAESHSHDGNGNRTNAGYATGLNNELTSDGTSTYTQDNEGNRLTRTKPGEITTYVWDYRNRLTRVYVQAVVGGPIVKDATYRYDVFDWRLGKTVDDDGAGPGVVSRVASWG